MGWIQERHVSLSPSLSFGNPLSFWLIGARSKPFCYGTWLIHSLTNQTAENMHLMQQHAIMIHWCTVNHLITRISVSTQNQFLQINIK
jgi:hypothetical protein